MKNITLNHAEVLLIRQAVIEEINHFQQFTTESFDLFHCRQLQLLATLLKLKKLPLTIKEPHD